MIDLYTAPTPNGWKISVMLEECELPYRVNWIDITRGDQFEPSFLEISPNNRIPAIVDTEPFDGGDSIAIFETGAILLYLADKTGRFIPQDLRGRKAVLEWLFWQVGGLGPMLGQYGYFKNYAPERIEFATKRYRTETLRLYGVLDRRLARAPYLAGDELSIADMAAFPWVQTYRAQDISLEDFGHVKQWYEELKQREGLRRGMSVGRDKLHDPEQSRIVADAPPPSDLES
jgi:GST-like protein